jgi:hypothetical protein
MQSKRNCLSDVSQGSKKIYQTANMNLSYFRQVREKRRKLTRSELTTVAIDREVTLTVSGQS